MTVQNQWLFEAPIAETVAEAVPEAMESEWEVSSRRSVRPGSGTALRRSRPITIKTSSLPPLKGQQNLALAEAPPPAPSIQLTGFPPTPPARGTTLLTHFSLGGAQLTPAHRKLIDKLVKDAIAVMPRMAPLSILVIQVEGHEDETGDPARFGNIGLKRASAVASVLATELVKAAKKVDPKNLRNVEIKTTSAGPNRPIRSNVTPDGRAFNRRVEVRMREDASRTV
jgi:outer membrane protein OmpA-like peptidoglycan-associated protein